MQHESTTANDVLVSRTLISSATILILAIVLLALGTGAQIPQENARTFLLWGCFGLSAYLILELAARYKSVRQYLRNQTAILHKLDQLITTDFTIQFVQRDTSMASPPGLHRKAQECEGRHLLVIDDEPHVAKLIARMLKGEGIPVRSCALPEEALELARDAMAILCDVHLAGVEGTDLVRSIRQDGYIGPIIMMSGDSARSTVKESLDAGIDDYLIKPFKRQALLQRVRRVISADAGSARGSHRVPT